MGNAVVNQAGFFFAADNLNGATKDSFGGLQELGCVISQAQRCGGDDPNLIARDILQAFREQPQTLPAALHGFL
ncbi:hypothetical protein D3C77_794880 [compost metagenome]